MNSNFSSKSTSKLACLGMFSLMEKFNERALEKHFETIVKQFVGESEIELLRANKLEREKPKFNVGKLIIPQSRLGDNKISERKEIIKRLTSLDSISSIAVFKEKLRLIIEGLGVDFPTLMSLVEDDALRENCIKILNSTK